MIAIERRRVLFKASTVVDTLEIMGVTNISAKTCQYVAIYNEALDVTSSATWSIISGSSYATIGANNGQVTVSSNANESLVIIQAEYMGVIVTKRVFLTYVNGASSETETEIVIDENGNTNTTITTITTNEDGSSTESTTTIITDESGNTIGSAESETKVNADGSYSGSTTNYDAEGNPTDGTNVAGDVEGNVSTQSVEYDDSGNTIVTGYDIDTSGSQDGAKSFSGDGVNTEYYAFDVTRGFVVNINFTINFNNQPQGQNENHHNILTAKRATPSPWYGFQLRQTGTNTYIILGTQFATGSNTNTTISGQSLGNNVYEYNLTITYDPTVSTNSFVCYNNLTQANVYRSNLKFPDIEELKYLKVVIGYAMNENGDPYRYSNINVKNFNLRRT